MEEIRSILENENIFLRKPEPEDLGFLFGVENNSEYWFVSDTKTPYSRWQIKQHIENSVNDIYTNKELRLIIVDISTGLQAGVIDLFDFDPVHERAGVGILVKKEFQHKGIASQALGLVIDYSFKILNLKQLWCNIDKENYVSIKLFLKFGFINCGELKSWKRNGKKFSDVLILQLINN